MGKPKAAYIIALLILWAFIQGFYLTLDRDAPPLAAACFALTLIWASCNWIRADAAQRRIFLPFDFGAYMYFVFPVVACELFTF